MTANAKLLLAIAASLCIGGAVGAGTTHYLASPAPQANCASDNGAWQKFMSSPPLPTKGKSYK